MSLIFTLTGKEPILKASFNPPIYVNKDYVLGFSSFESFNTIPNITTKNNTFYYGKNKAIVIPPGSYEISDIERLINVELEKRGKNYFFSLKANHNTLKSIIKCTIDIDFRPDDCIGPLLGFSKRLLEANGTHESDTPVNILSINALCIYCNIASGSYTNGQPSHIIHEFFPTVPVGFKIVESPDQIIYLPINVNVIDELIIKILDQDGNLVSFEGEVITVGLHLKKLT